MCEETVLLYVYIHVECSCVLCFDMLQSYQKLGVLCMNALNSSDCVTWVVDE